VVDDLGQDLKIPGRSYGFRTLIAAQAAGDFEALREGGRRVVRVEL
jgi:transaldolase/glucose-6-phosphate isomerase